MHTYYIPAPFCCPGLEENLLTELPVKCVQNSEYITKSAVDWPGISHCRALLCDPIGRAHEVGGKRRSVADCLTCAYLLTDIETSKKNLMVSGSTSVSCLLMPTDHAGGDGRVLYTANVGDSRAVLCRGGRAVRLSYDHKASDAAEQKRIEGSGGFVLRRRVLGILSVSRSFGDHALKPDDRSQKISWSKLCTRVYGQD